MSILKATKLLTKLHPKLHPKLPPADKYEVRWSAQAGSFPSFLSTSDASEALAVLKDNGKDPIGSTVTAVKNGRGHDAGACINGILLTAADYHHYLNGTDGGRIRHFVGLSPAAKRWVADADIPFTLDGSREACRRYGIDHDLRDELLDVARLYQKPPMTHAEAKALARRDIGENCAAIMRRKTAAKRCELRLYGSFGEGYKTIGEGTTWEEAFANVAMAADSARTR